MVISASCAWKDSLAASTISWPLFLCECLSRRSSKVFQEYARTKRPQLFAVWARMIRSFCLPVLRHSSATTPKAEVHFYDTGHFALETHHQEISAAIRDFLIRNITTQAQVAEAGANAVGEGVRIARPRF